MDPKSIKIGLGAPQSRLGGVQEASWRQKYTINDEFSKVYQKLDAKRLHFGPQNGPKIDKKSISKTI